MQFTSPADVSPISTAEPPRDCPLCPRLVALREEMRADCPNWWNAPVPTFGDPDAWLAIVGLAPGRKGANRTGRPFTGDFAGDLLFATLAKFGLTEGEYRASRDDGLRLKGIVIVNAVKCLPPGNKPSPREVATCGDHYLKPSFAALPRVKIIIALGRIAHDATLRVFDRKPPGNAFRHGAEHQLPGGRLLIDSYHCSRQNVNTRRLTPAMFETLFEKATAKNG